MWNKIDNQYLYNVSGNEHEYAAGIMKSQPALRSHKGFPEKLS